MLLVQHWVSPGLGNPHYTVYSLQAIHFANLHPWRLSGKESASNAGNTGDAGLIPGLGRSSGEGNGNSFQYSCLGNPMERGNRQATAHGVTRNWTQLSMPTQCNIVQNDRFVCKWIHSSEPCIFLEAWLCHFRIRHGIKRQKYSRQNHIQTTDITKNAVLFSERKLRHMKKGMSIARRVIGRKPKNFSGFCWYSPWEMWIYQLLL